MFAKRWRINGPKQQGNMHFEWGNILKYLPLGLYQKQKYCKCGVYVNHCFSPHWLEMDLTFWIIINEDSLFRTQVSYSLCKNLSGVCLSGIKFALGTVFRFNFWSSFKKHVTFLAKSFMWKNAYTISCWYPSYLIYCQYMVLYQGFMSFR